MTFPDIKTDPVPAILKSGGFPIRGAALLASILGLTLPAVTTSAMGLSQSANTVQIAPWSLIVPIAVALAVILPGLAAHLSRLGDAIAAVMTIVVLAYASYMVFDAWNQLTQLTGSTTGMLRSMAGNSPDMQAYANSFGQNLGVSVMPGFGLAIMMCTAMLMTMQALRPRR